LLHPVEAIEDGLEAEKNVRRIREKLEERRENTPKLELGKARQERREERMRRKHEPTSCLSRAQ